MRRLGSRVVDIDVVELMKAFTLTVTVKRTKELRVRLWLAAQLMRLAAWVAGMKSVVMEE